MALTPEVQRLRTVLDLTVHPEGGWFREIYRSTTDVGARAGQRSAITTIWYLLAGGQISRWHVVDSDEIWHLLQGTGLELLTYSPSTRQVIRRVLSTEEPQNQVVVVPAGIWQAARPLGEFALSGCTVGPGFSFEDFRFVSSLPEHVDHLNGEFGRYADLL